MRRLERSDAFPVDDDDETDTRRCSIFVIGATFPCSAYVIKDLRRDVSPTILFPRMLLLLDTFCNFDRSTTYLQSSYKVILLCAPQYVF